MPVPDDDRPEAMHHVDALEQGADRYQPAHFGQQAATYGNTAAKARDLGQQLKTHRDDLLRGWEGKDADAVAAHVDKLIKGAQGMEDKATEAQGALKDVTSIMEKAKAEIKQIAAEAKKADKNNRKLIADAKTSKSDDLESASKTIAKLKADNEHMSGQAQKQIEQKLQAVESQIDSALQPLGIKIAPGGGFTDITPAQTAPAAVTDPGPTINPSEGSTNSAGMGGAADTGSSSGGAVAASGSSSGSSSSSGGTSASATPSGPPPKPIPAGEKNPAKIAEALKGQWASDLMNNQAVPMDKGIDTTVCCANFVTACLKKAGLINWHADAVADAQQKLLADGWQQISPSEAKPGDVAIVNGGHHIELCDGNGNLIGSNNTNGGSGPQHISIDPVELKSATMVLRPPSK